MRHGEIMASVCPHCGSDQVETTLHAVYRRKGNDLIPVPEASETETICEGCGKPCSEEPAEILLRERYPELFEVKE